MTYFLGIFQKLSERVDKCISLPNSSKLRFKLLMQELDDEEKKRIGSAFNKKKVAA